MGVSQIVQVHANGVVYETAWFGHAMFDRYVCIANFIEYVISIRQNIF